MSNYVKATNFTAKDSLPSGNSGKIIKGAEIDTEYTAIASAISSKADLNSPTLTGTPTAPTASVGTNTTQIATTAFVLANSVPSGLISMWSGSIASIPSGWVLCNGSNSTPDLRNKFIIGAYSDNVGVANTTITGTNTLTGGSKDAIVVTHTHTTTVTDPGHTHSFAYGVLANASQTAINGSGSLVGGTTLSATQSNTTGITVANANTGSSGTDANLPPYYALAYIMKT